MDGYLAEGFHGREREFLGVSRKGEAGVFQEMERGKAEVFQERICV